MAALTSGWLLEGQLEAVALVRQLLVAGRRRGDSAGQGMLHWLDGGAAVQAGREHVLIVVVAVLLARPLAQICLSARGQVLTVRVLGAHSEDSRLLKGLMCVCAGDHRASSVHF